MRFFEMFPAQWTPIVFSRELRAEPVGVAVAGTPVVLFRDQAGKARALLDHCPHRGARLSLGRMNGGCIECPFHGWRYDGGGHCVHVPFSGVPDGKLATIRVGSVATHEEAGLVFVFTAPDVEPPELPRIPEELTRAGVHVARHAETWRTHWSRAMENMLDAPHLPFVHRRTIGRPIRRRMTDRSVMDVSVQETAYGFRTTNAIDGQDSGAWLDWNRPNGMVLNIPIPHRTFRQHVYCVPVGPDETRMMLLTTRDFAVHNPLARLGDLYSLRVMYEDRKVIESIRPFEVPPAAHEHSARTDRATLAFRKWYYDAFKGGP